MAVVLQVEDLERVKVMSGKQLESFLKVSPRLGPAPLPACALPPAPALTLFPFPPVAGEHLGSRRGPVGSPS